MRRSRGFVSLLTGLLTVALISLVPAPSASADSTWQPRPHDPEAATARTAAYPFAPFDFLFRQRGGAPVAYSPCVPHPVVVNPANTTPEIMAMTQEVIARVAQTTGLNLYYAGATGQSFGYGIRRKGALKAPIVVSFESRMTVPRLEGSVLGMGFSYVVKKKRFKQLAAGRLVIDIEDYRQLAASPTYGPKAMQILRATLLHEFGHVVGLAHVSDPAQLMYPMQGDSVFDFAAGDLQGLYAVGHQACGPVKHKKKRKRRR